MEELISIIQNMGFPIAMCIYFVVRFEKILNNNTKALNKILEKLNG